MTHEEAKAIIKKLNYPEVDEKKKREAIDLVMNSTLFYELKHRDFLTILPWMYKRMK